MYALYDNCPGVGGNIIQGTAGQITIPVELELDIVTNTVTIPIEQSIILPCNIWLGLKTSRDNVGIIMGAPPTHGFSEDIVDFPGFACNADIGGFPSFGHATFNAEIFGDATCSPAFLGYRNEKAFKGGFSIGADILIADDIELGGQGCQMVAYEVGVRGPGLYTFDLRRDAGGIPGSLFSGTRKLFIHNENTFRSQCFFFTSPITLDNKFFVTFKVGNDIGGWVLTGHDASWGHTTESFAIKNDQGVWEFPDPGPDIPDFGGFYFSVHCAGEQLSGACCDMYFTDDEGEAVCRDLPEMNCPFPPRDENLRPAWRQGVSCRVCSHGINAGLPCSDFDDCLGMFCDNDGTECIVDNDCTNGSCVTATCDDNNPFVVTCGQAACCKPAGALGLGCENLTQNECFAVEPVENPREWQLGKICGARGQRCPLPPCIGRTGDCIGSENIQCKGGPLDGEPCNFDDCACRGCCDFSNQTCVGGSNDTGICLNDSNCPNGRCRGFCYGGISDPTQRCISHGVCQFDSCVDGICLFDGPGPGVCNGGDRHGAVCNSDRECKCTTCECAAGCEDPICCSDVCDIFDPYCCEICWDSACAALAESICDSLPLKNDTCAPEKQTKGAQLISLNMGVEFDANRATSDPDDPGICCNTGPRRRCIEGGAYEGKLCETHDDCLCRETASICCDATCCDADPDCDSPARDGFCPLREESQGARAMNTVWFRFEVPERTSDQDPEFVSVRLYTCGSNQPATDSLLQVFSIPTSDMGTCEDLGRCIDGSSCNVITNQCNDGSNCTAIFEQCSVSAQGCPAQTNCVFDLNLACDNLSVVGCNDDAETSCAGQVYNSDLCLPDLKRGQSYIVLLGVKEPEAIGTYKLGIQGVSSCPATGLEDNDQCDNAFVVTENVTAFDLNQASFSCPEELCLPEMQNDLWFSFTPQISGEITIETCGADLESTPNTEMIVYKGCICPPTRRIDCSGTATGDCFVGSRSTLNVTGGQCYLIRVADNAGNGGMGNLTINLTPDCNENGIPDDEDIAGGTSPDINGNGIPDECEDGSCCIERISCSIIRESDCTIGEWVIDGTCDPVQCLPPLGACCDSNSGLGGQCIEDVPEIECQNDLHVWHEFSKCNEIVCEEVRGFCCDLRTGSCLEAALQEECSGDELVWGKLDTCDQIICNPFAGACCDRNPGSGGKCTETLFIDCQGELISWNFNTTCVEITCEEITGACCDVRPGLGGICSDDVLIADCQDEFDSWSVDALCSEIVCEEISGACCDVSSGLGGLCLDQVIQADCQSKQQTWVVETSCIEITCDEVSGACCDRLDGFCRNGLLKSECGGAQPIWNEGLSCIQILCDPAMGACCNTRFGTCTTTILADCIGEQFSWTKGEFCSVENCPDPFIPTISQWGLMILTLLLLIGAKVYFNGRNLQEVASE